MFMLIQSFKAIRRNYIYRDDTDITQIGIDILRKNLMIIPQDSYLMKGSLKNNIYPFNKSKEILLFLY